MRYSDVCDEQWVPGGEALSKTCGAGGQISRALTGGINLQLPSLFRGNIKCVLNPPQYVTSLYIYVSTMFSSYIPKATVFFGATNKLYLSFGHEPGEVGYDPSINPEIHNELIFRLFYPALVNFAVDVLFHKCDNQDSVSPRD